MSFAYCCTNTCIHFLFIPKFIMSLQAFLFAVLKVSNWIIDSLLFCVIELNRCHDSSLHEEMFYLPLARV